MDIAEIRRKAREEKSSAAGPASSAPSGAAGDVTPSDPEPKHDLQVGDSPVESDEVFADESEDDGLDKLFSSELSLEPVSAGSSAGAAAPVVVSEDLLHQYLAFNLGREEYALDIRSISEIIKVRDFTDVPRAPGFVLGVISLRGVVVPVYDLMSRLQLGQSVITVNSRIIVCQDDDLMVGLLVDSISQVIKLADDRIEPPPQVLSGLERDMMKGVGRSQGRMIVLLNIANVLQVELT